MGSSAFGIVFTIYRSFAKNLLLQGSKPLVASQ
jgi:hypothetical protein